MREGIDQQMARERGSHKHKIILQDHLRRPGDSLTTLSATKYLTTLNSLSWQRARQTIVCKSCQRDSISESPAGSPLSPGLRGIKEHQYNAVISQIGIFKNYELYKRMPRWLSNHTARFITYKRSSLFHLWRNYTSNFRAFIF